MRARTPQDPGSGGLCPEAAAQFVGVGRDSWDQMWKGHLAPAPSRPKGRTLIWSIHELSAWLAHGMPGQEQWRAIWTKMLEKGTWQAPMILHLASEGGQQRGSRAS